MNPLILIGIIASLIEVGVAAAAKVPKYHLAPLFLVPLTWLPVIFRRKLHLLPLHYALVCVAILIHMIGAFGYYTASPLPFSFDILVHYYFAFAAAFIFHRAIRTNFPLKLWQVNVTVLLFLMGFGALHEIMEFCSYLLLGDKNGMIRPQTDYVFDTARDLTDNFLGTMTALIIISVAHWARRRSAASDVDPSNDPSRGTAPLHAVR